MKVKYDSNNSGGNWWLKDEDWNALETAGWDVAWKVEEHKREMTEAQARLDADEYTDEEREEYLGRSWDEKLAAGKGGLGVPDEDGRWLGALATEASKDFETPAEAIREWEQITGEDASNEGCNCCGPPHSFNWGGKDTGLDYDSVSGEDILPYLFGKDQPTSLREAIERGNTPPTD